MRFTVTEFVATCIAAGAIMNCSIAAEKAPHILTEPVFRTHYDSRTVKFEPLPADALKNCSLIMENTNFTSVWFIFGRVQDDIGRTFYAVSGYEIANRPRRGQSKFETEGFGWVFQTHGDTCTMIGDVQETFNARYFVETPQLVLQDLARDVAARYERAYNGKDGVKRMLRKHRVKADPYAEELNAAFRQYFD